MTRTELILVGVLAAAACSKKSAGRDQKAAAGAGHAAVKPFDGVEDMIEIPGATFRGRGFQCLPGTMTPAGQGSAEVDLHVAAYKIDRDVVTCAQMKHCEEAGACHPGDDGMYCHWGAVMATLDEAVEYCAWRRAKLPTYAQWQRAGRGPDDKRFPWGSTWQDPDCDNGDGLQKASERGHGKRCVYETGGFTFEAGSNPNELTADVDCGTDLHPEKRPLPVVVLLGGFQLDEESTEDPSRAAGEFRCARQDVEIPR